MTVRHATRDLAVALLVALGGLWGLWPVVLSGQTTSHAAAPPAPPQPAVIPPITDADRQAAFPDVQGHSVHDNAVNYFVLVDQFEWQIGAAEGASWDSRGWIGRDRDRFWFRTEGGTANGRLDQAEAHALYGRAIARWWDVVVGVRQDVRPGGAQTWAAVGIQGLAPYWFEVQATAYLGASGRTHLRFETEYALLLTNHLILQPLVEVQIYGTADPGRGIGAGLSSVDAGLRLRYQFRRELAPYVGVTWNRKVFGTAAYARAGGANVGGAKLALGLRLWL
jgi:copper resistance protein B